MSVKNEKAFTCVYIAALPEGDVSYPVYPEEREAELCSVSSDIVRREKYYAWRLLDHALRESLGLTLEEASPRRVETGRWVSDAADFSISHSGGAVAVAVSGQPVGVDVERCGHELGQGFASRMLTERELASLCEGSDAVLELWCRKEAIFKMGGGSRFIPREVESDSAPVHVERVALPRGEFILAVATHASADLTVQLCGAEVFD